MKRSFSRFRFFRCLRFIFAAATVFNTLISFLMPPRHFAATPDISSPLLRRHFFDD
jgi:hypothetical protein